MNTKEVKRSKDKSPKVVVTENGPYLVFGNLPLTKEIITVGKDGEPEKWTKGEKCPPQESYALCRCSNSKNKPYCDGAHTKIGFKGTETADQEHYLDQPKVINGPALKLTDVEKLCASARFCHRAGGIWNLVPKSDKPKAKKIAQEEACDCPSGRLTVQDNKAQKTLEPKFEPAIGLVEDPAVGVSGPIWLRGGIPVESAKGKTYRVRNRVTLCRCGKSKNKPFCDSSHYPE